VCSPATLAVVLVLVLAGCGGGPSKSQALESLQSGVKEDGSCTLPAEVLTTLKMQHATRALCVPREGAERARACIDALVAAGLTRRMPDAYMLGWPDDEATASLKDIPAYERRARNLVYLGCVELSDGLREGRFACADVRATKVLKVTSTDATHADVLYERELSLQPAMAAIEAACGAVSRPAGEATVTFEKGASGWAPASASLAPTAPFVGH
jgi:hypothetical protein